MVNPFTGPDSTASHFFIAAKKFLLDGKRVTFGKRNNALLVLLCFCINRSQYDDDDDYINLCHKISWLPQVLLSFTVPSRLYILLVQGFLLADFALENINIYKAAKFLERQARKT
uniref:Calcium-transporting ATPase 8 family protein n=1 Tax=Populus alba TaxID=43335 RepID=A0A4U5PM89_POPAL|nr:Calcium-transporting ATPase 8 family protein [Populus alba]